MHDPNADIHTLQDVDIAFVHPHTAVGYGFLVRRLGLAVMDAYEHDDIQPTLPLEDLAGLIEAATREGVTVEQTATYAAARLGLTNDRRN
jgi:hypothetical protein